MTDEEDARAGRDARVAEIARRVADERISAMWTEFGVIYSTDAGRERHRAVLDWARASSDRAAGQGRRLALLVSIIAGVGTFLTGIIKWVVDYHLGGGGIDGHH